MTDHARKFLVIGAEPAVNVRAIRAGRLGLGAIVVENKARGRR